MHIYIYEFVSFIIMYIQVYPYAFWWDECSKRAVEMKLWKGPYGNLVIILDEWGYTSHYMPD